MTLPRESSHAIDLAIVRIVIFGLLIANRDAATAIDFAALDPALRVTPMRWAMYVPIDVGCARAAYWILIVAGSAALIGLRTRLAATIAVLAATYVLGIPQLYGTTRHYHHLVWFAAILACSPSGDALSIDALLRARRGETRPLSGQAYALPLRLVWLLYGCIFLFPGLWKWRTSGLAWATSDNLLHQMQAKWLEYDWLPIVRLDWYPRVCHAAAWATMIFEIAFVFALIDRRSRRVAVVLAMVFHVATAVFMHIVFATLLWGYVAFVPWSRWLAARYEAWRATFGAPRALPARRALPIAIVGAIVVAGVVIAGATRSVEAWPFACYPPFDRLMDDELLALEIDVVAADGSTHTLPRARIGNIDSQRRWALDWSLALSPSPTALRHYYEQLNAHELGAREARFYRVFLSIAPEHWHDPPRRRELVGVIALQK